LKFFDFVERNFGIDFLKKLICYKDFENRTFLFDLFQFADKSLIKILSFLFEKFRNEKNFLEKLLLSVDEDGNSFLIFYFLQRCPDRMIKASKEFFELIKINFGVDFLKKLLLIRNKNNENFHLALLSNKWGGVKKSLQVLEILLEVVGKDKEFFTELTNQIKIPKEIREFLKTYLEIETKAWRGIFKWIKEDKFTASALFVLFAFFIFLFLSKLFRQLNPWIENITKIPQ
jgi:hypothetical protein